MDWAIRMVLLIGLPAALALAVLAEPLLSTLFQYGEFAAGDVVKTAQSLRAASAGLLAAMFIKVLAPGFYARQDTKTPVKIGVLAMAANMIFAALLVWEFHHVGLATAMALSSWLNAGLLYAGLRKAGVYKPQAGWLLHWGRMLGAGVGMAGATWWLSMQTSVWTEAGVWHRVGWLSLIVVSGLVLYALALLILGLRPRHLRR